MSVRKVMASLAALGLVMTGVAASPIQAQDDDDEAALDDAGLWMLGGFIVGEGILVAILASEDDIERIPDPEPTPVSP